MPVREFSGQYRSVVFGPETPPAGTPPRPKTHPHLPLALVTLLNASELFPSENAGLFRWNYRVSPNYCLPGAEGEAKEVQPGFLRALKFQDSFRGFRMSEVIRLKTGEC